MTLQGDMVCRPHDEASWSKALRRLSTRVAAVASQVAGGVAAQAESWDVATMVGGGAGDAGQALGLSAATAGVVDEAGNWKG
eukprot:6491311-Amphidinium_carterae.2